MAISRLLRRLLPIESAGLVLIGTSIASEAKSICDRTPELALRMTPSSITIGTLSREGYRVTGVRRDPLLNQRWATIASCGHPERPSIAMRISDPEIQRTPFNSSDLAQQTPVLVIHGGDLVKMWGEEQNLRI